MWFWDIHPYLGVIIQKLTCWWCHFFPAYLRSWSPDQPRSSGVLTLPKFQSKFGGLTWKNTKKNVFFCGMGDTRATPNAGFLKLVGRIKCSDTWPCILDGQSKHLGWFAPTSSRLLGSVTVNVNWIMQACLNFWLSCVDLYSIAKPSHT